MTVPWTHSAPSASPPRILEAARLAALHRAPGHPEPLTFDSIPDPRAARPPWPERAR